jgi:hypothetical protein
MRCGGRSVLDASQQQAAPDTIGLLGEGPMATMPCSIKTVAATDMAASSVFDAPPSFNCIEAHMKKMPLVNCLVATLIVVSLAGRTSAQAPADLPVVKTHYEQVEATVTAIDAAKRELSLRAPTGSVSVVAGDGVRNFDKIHVGDKVVVSYYQGLAVQLAKGSAKVMEPAASTFDYRAGKGDRPGAGVGASVTETVTIVAIEKDTNTVAFTTHDGAVHLVAVKSPNMVQFLNTLKAGDTVEVTYTESLAIKVEPSTH